MEKKLLGLLLTLVFVLTACWTPGIEQTPGPTAPRMETEMNDASLDKDEKIELTMVAVEAIDAHGANAMAARFDQQSEDYYVTVLDYSENGAYTTDQAIQRLHADMATGRNPDLFFFSEAFSPLTYISRGYLADLLPLVDADPDLEREDIALLPALLVEDGLYYLGNRFTVETALGRHDVFGDRYGWTFDEYLEMESSGEYKEMTYNLTHDNFLGSLASRYLTTAVDWKAGTCDFDNAEFRALLEICARSKETPEPEDAREMDFTWPSVRVMKKTLATALCWVDSAGALAREEQMAGTEMSWVGWPTVDGSCGTDANFSVLIGMGSQTTAPEGCWEFIRQYFVGADPTEENGFPLYRPALEKYFVLAKEKESTQSEVKITERDVERLQALFSQICRVAINDKTLLQIIQEEGAAYFSGDQSLENTVKLIQSRASLYLAEQKN